MVGTDVRRVWALSDLHLSLGTDKPMDIFGDHWRNHHQQMADALDQHVAPDDILLTPGDFSWAAKPDQVGQDMAWLGQRPGHKVMFKGNHDYWWPGSKTKLKGLLAENTYACKKTACIIGDIGIFGVRGGDFAPLVKYGDKRSQEDVEAALEREERELVQSLDDLKRQEAERGAPCALRICCFHYPPIAPGRSSSRFTPIITESGAKVCIYGHLHGNELGPAKVEGTFEGVIYRCASCDVLDFEPLLVAEVSDGLVEVKI